MSRSQPSGRFPSSSGAGIDVLETTPSLFYSDAELLPNSQDHAHPHAHRQRVAVPNQPGTEPALRISPPRPARTSRIPIHIDDRSRSWARSTSRARSPTRAPRVMDPGRSSLAGAVMTRRAEPQLPDTLAIDIPRPLAGSSHNSTRYLPDSDSELYVDSDGDFAVAKSSLLLEIRPNIQDSEKWELPDGGSVRDFLGNGWKLKVVVSYTSVDPDFEPSVSVDHLEVDCTLADIPRNVPTTAKRFRKPGTTFRVSHNGGTTKSDKLGNIEGMMDPTRGIYRDHDWQGPTLAKTMNRGVRRMEYFTNIYIPIPVWLFAVCETRTFDIEVRAWVSLAHAFPVTLRRLEQLNFSNFIQVNRDGSTGCALLG